MHRPSLSLSRKLESKSVDISTKFRIITKEECMVISKLPEAYWKKMRFCLLSIIHILGNHEKENIQCAKLLKKMKKYLQILKNISFLEWKIGFHFQVKCKESGKKHDDVSEPKGIRKKDVMKLRFLWLQLLFLVRACSEKSFERTYSPGLDLTRIRKKLTRMRDEMSEDLKILDNFYYRDNGVEYTFFIESKSGQKPDWH